MPARINTPRTRQQRRRLAAADFFRRQQLQRIRGAANIWTPAALFSAGQKGVWYEPRPEYLYQDSAGTTPVTADGDPVGLMLDRSRGLVKGLELVANGGFDEDLSGWSAGSNLSAAQDSGEAEVTFGGAANATTSNWFSYDENSNIGNRYLVEFDATHVSGGNLTVSATYNSDVVITASENGGVKKRYSRYINHVPAISAGRVIIFAAPDGSVWRLDNVSSREVQGNHALQSTASYKPLYAITPDQLDFDDFDDVLPVTFPVDMGANVTIARAVPGVGGEILTGQAVGTSYDIVQGMAALIIVNETPSAESLSKLQSYLDTMAGV